MNRTSLLVATLMSVVALGLFSACSLAPAPRADPTRFFVLDPALQTDAHTPLPERVGSISIGLKSVEIPIYLDRVEIAIRTSANETVYQPYARWAEPLGPAIQRQLTLQLLQSPRIGRIDTMPFSLVQGLRDYDIAIQVTRCEGQLDANGKTTSSFSAIIVITRSVNGAIVARQNFVAPSFSWDGQDNAKLVQALSESVTKLGEAILAALPQES